MKLTRAERRVISTMLERHQVMTTAQLHTTDKLMVGLQEKGLVSYTALFGGAWDVTRAGMTYNG